MRNESDASAFVLDRLRRVFRTFVLSSTIVLAGVAEDAAAQDAYQLFESVPVRPMA